jgi:signal transduction histidine kinase
LGIAQDITQRKQVELALQHVNATLERRIEELVVLNHIAQALTRWTDLHDALGTVQTNLARLFAAAEVSVWRLDGGAALTRLNGSKTQAMPAVPVDTPLMRRVIGERETILLRPEEGLPTELAFNGATGGALLVPLQIRNAATGLLCLRAAQRERVYTPDEVALAQTVAGVLAGAIENAQLFAQAQRLAAQEERQRLSRDLHDSVSQALFAASVSADVAPQLWELDPDEGREMLQEVRRLTRGALAEMRMLLVELRPAQLLHTPLQELLNHLVTAANTRLRGTATVQIAPLPMLPLELRVALYRIAQEALGNIVKHAQATRIMLSLHTSPPVASEGATDWTGSLELCIADDGRGFTATDAATRRGIGLYSMEERAHGVRATLQIDSTPGNGTRISVCWQGAACYIGD